MGFESFTRMAGYEKYVGRNEYPSDNDYDGTWGIYDGPFLQYFANETNVRIVIVYVKYISCCHIPSSVQCLLCIWLTNYLRLKLSADEIEDILHRRPPRKTCAPILWGRCGGKIVVEDDHTVRAIENVVRLHIPVTRFEISPIFVLAPSVVSRHEILEYGDELRFQ
jgi:hypothetical protein